MALPLIPLAMLAASAVGTGLKALPNRADKRNRARLSDLELLEEQDQLGMTDQEQEAFMGRQNLQIAQRQQQADAQQRVMTVGNPGGDVEARQIAAQDQGALARTAALSDMEKLDLQRKQEQRQEIEDRTAAAAARQNERVADFSSLITDVAGTIGGQASLNLTTQGPRLAKNSQLMQRIADLPDEDWNDLVSQLGV